MSVMKVLRVTLDTAESQTALIAGDDSVWLPVVAPWWALATWLWYWLAPTERKARITITNSHGVIASVRALRLGTHHARVRGKVQ